MAVSDVDISRHRELFDPNKFNKAIHVIGVGATGSWLVFSLAKLGLTNIHVYDFDKVEAHNIANQLFSISDIGEYKVEALKRIVKDTTGTEITIHNKEVKEEAFSGIVFMMIDTMAGRKAIYESSVKYKPSVSLLIEPRMGLHMARIYNILPLNNSSLNEYEKTFYTDEEAEVSACGNSMTIISSALAVTAWCVRQLINFANECEMDEEILIELQNNYIITSKWK